VRIRRIAGKILQVFETPPILHIHYFPPPYPVCQAKQTLSGILLSATCIAGMAAATGIHLCRAHSWLIRIPIRKTTYGLSMRAV